MGRAAAEEASKTALVSLVTPSHLKAGLDVSGSLIFSIMRSDVSTLQMSYSRRTFVFIAPASGSTAVAPGLSPPLSCRSSERAACSSEITPSMPGVATACRKSPTNLVDSSRIDFSLRPSTLSALSAPPLAVAPITGPVSFPPFSLPAVLEPLIAAPARLGSSTSSSTIGFDLSSRSTHAGILESPSHVYEDARSFWTTSSDSSTLTMS